jgi:hypothetical protein
MMAETMLFLLSIAHDQVTIKYDRMKKTEILLRRR